MLRNSYIAYLVTTDKLSTLFVAPLKYRPIVFNSSVCDAVSVWSTSNLKCLNIIWKENISYLTENLDSNTETIATVLFREIIASETYTYILCYRNSRFSSVKAGDITTLCSCIQLFLLPRNLSEFGDILLFPEHHFYVVTILMMLSMRNIMSLVFWDVTSCTMLYKGLPRFWIKHCLSSRRRM